MSLFRTPRGQCGRIRTWRWTSMLVALCCSSAILTGCKYELPEVSLDNIAPAQTSSIYAGDGTTLITDMHSTENRELVPLSRISQVMQDAVIAIEDSRFYQHHGVDYYGLGRAVVNNAEGKDLQGASTITQQLIKQRIVGDKKTLDRKVKEATLALALEKKYSKERILEEYLNTVYLGSGAYGVQAAARTYFQVDASQLNLVQASLLAGVIRSPNNYDPGLHEDAAIRRRNSVLDRMLTLNYISQLDHDTARMTVLGVAVPPKDQQYVAPFFVEEVKRFIMRDESFGEAIRSKGLIDTEEARRELLFRGGIRVFTTVDLPTQIAAEEAAKAVLPDPSLPDSAVVVLDPTTGFVKAIVGGRDFFGADAQAKFDLAIQGKRQAGSAFKPFVLAQALETGIPLTRTYAAPTTLSIPQKGGADWEVSNAEKTSGDQLDLVEATVHSINTVYAQLMVDVGPSPAMGMANRLGIESTLTPNLAAVLGTNSVSPLEMASAYGTFANRGVHTKPKFISKVVAKDGTVLYEAPTSSERIIKAETADEISAVLTQTVERGTGTSAKIDGREIAGKTGTATEYRDAWFVGYTPQLVTAVWVGYAQGQIEMKPPKTPIRVFGGTYPARIFRATMTSALADKPAVNFTKPPIEVGTPGITKVEVPNLLGKTVEQARAALQARGFQVTLTSVTNDQVRQGSIASQTPAGGSKVDLGSTVTIAVSDPDGYVPLPDLIGETADSAKTQLTNAGMKVNVEKVSEPSGAGGPGNVWRQIPGSGTRVPKGSLVSITVNPAA